MFRPDTISAGSLSSLIYPLTARVVGAPQMISQPVSSIFACSHLPSGTWRTPGHSIPWSCLPTSSSVCLVFFPLSLCLARWFWPDLMNRRHDNTTAVWVSLQSWHGLPRWQLGCKIWLWNRISLKLSHLQTHFSPLATHSINQLNHDWSAFWYLLLLRCSFNRLNHVLVAV